MSPGPASGFKGRDSPWFDGCRENEVSRECLAKPTGLFAAVANFCAAAPEVVNDRTEVACIDVDLALRKSRSLALVRWGRGISPVCSIYCRMFRRYLLRTSFLIFANSKADSDIALIVFGSPSRSVIRRSNMCFTATN